MKTYKEEQIVNTNIPYNDAEPDEDNPIMKTETQEVEISKRFQEAVILKLPESETRFNVGDTIIYMVGQIFEFDFIKGVSMLHKYDPVALIV